MRVIVTEYQPAWVEQFEEEAQALKQILKENCLKVEHIGSTSVPNLAAKPIIDFLVIVEEIEKVDLLQGEFERIGYEYMGEFGLSGRRYLRKGPIKEHIMCIFISLTIRKKFCAILLFEIIYEKIWQLLQPMVH